MSIKSPLRIVLTGTALLCSAAIIMSGCGSDSDSKSTSSSDTKTTETTASTETTDTSASTDTDAAAQVIEVGIIKGKMRFDKDKLDAKAGKVTFKFNNTESIPHDFVIELDGKRIDGTDLITNSSAEFTVDLKAGNYDFYCTPHRSIGMVGKLTVA